jgi:hypothetical protein
MDNEQLIPEPDKIIQTSVDVDMTIGSLEIDTAQATVISEQGPKPPADPDMVKFKASYPKDWSSEKHMQDGKVYDVHKDTAARFQELKIGKIVK